MNTPHPWVLCLVLIGSLGCAQHSPAEAKPGAEAKPRAEAKLDYIERLTGGAKAGETLPLILAIHGLGDSPEAFVSLFDDLSIKARIIAPRAPDPYDVGTSWYPIDDTQRSPRVIRERAQGLSELLTQLARARPTQGKPVITGFSQGGVLSFAMAAYHSGQLRAALPIAGSLPLELRSELPEAGASIEIIAFHGKADPRIPFADGESTLRALGARGHKTTLKAYDRVGHTIPRTMQDELYAALQRVLQAN